MLVGLRSLHTGRGREGAPNFDPSEDLVSVEWLKRNLFYLTPRGVFIFPSRGPIVLGLFIIVGVVLGLVSSQCLRVEGHSRAPSRPLRDGVVFGECRPGLLLGGVVLGRHRLGFCGMDLCTASAVSTFCWAALYSVGIVLAFAGQRCARPVPSWPFAGQRRTWWVLFWVGTVSTFAGRCYANSAFAGRRDSRSV